MWETIHHRLIPTGAHAQILVHSWRLKQPLCVFIAHVVFPETSDDD